MKLLWLKYGEMLPPDTGGKLRSYHLLRALRSEVDLRLVSYVHRPVTPGYAEALGSEFPGARVLEIEGGRLGREAAALGLSASHGLPLTVSRFTSRRVRSYLRRHIAADPPDVLLCDFLTPGECIPRDVATATVLFEHNVESSLWGRKASSSRGLKGLVYGWESRALKRYEIALLRRFGAVLSVSQADKVQLERLAPGIRVNVVETGVDIAAFAPLADNMRSAGDVVFVGSMDWQPNIQGVQWFLTRIWPQVSAECPDAVFHVVGRRPPSAIRQLESANVRVTGDVASVRPYLNRAAVSVVPLLAGGGTRLKIYEAMAAGAPVLSTTVGAEGLLVTPGRDIVIADDPQSFADELIALLRHADRRGVISAAGAASVAAKDWSVVAAEMAGFLRDVDRNARARSGPIE